MMLQRLSQGSQPELLHDSLNEKVCVELLSFANFTAALGLHATIID